MSRKELQRIIDFQTRNLRQMTEKEQAVNLQLQNALYAGKMGLYAFHLKTGDLVQVYNNLIPGMLGFSAQEYSSNLMEIVRGMSHHEVNKRMQDPDNAIQ